MSENPTAEKASIAGHLYITDVSGRALLLRGADGQWHLPGAVVEAGADPWAATMKAMVRRTGTYLLPTCRLLVTVVRSSGGTRDEAAVEFVFDGGHLVKEILDCIRLSPADTAWRTRDLKDWEPTVAPDVYSMLYLADVARRTGRAEYACDSDLKILTRRASRR